MVGGVGEDSCSTHGWPGRRAGRGNETQGRCTSGAAQGPLLQPGPSCCGHHLVSSLRLGGLMRPRLPPSGHFTSTSLLQHRSSGTPHGRWSWPGLSEEQGRVEEGEGGSSAGCAAWTAWPPLQAG